MADDSPSGSIRDLHDRQTRQETLTQLRELNKTLSELKDELRAVNSTLDRMTQVIGSVAAQNRQP